MSKLSVGDTVSVNFTGTIEEVKDYTMPLGIRHVVRSDTGAAHMLFDQAEGKDFKVERKTPEYWPPLKGDIWKADNGNLFFGRCNHDPVQLYNSTISRGGELPQEVLNSNPGLRLVFRNL